MQALTSVGSVAFFVGARFVLLAKRNWKTISQGTPSDWQALLQSVGGGPIWKGFSLL